MTIKKKKVLYITDTLKQRFGITSVIMNYLRHIDYTKVHIDVLAYRDSEVAIVEEIKKLGGNVYYMPTLGIKNILMFIQYMQCFFKENKYDIIHSHFYQIDAIVFPIAKKYGVNCCISHSHNTKYSDYKFRAIRNHIMSIPIKKVADYWAACSKIAGCFLYGKDYLYSQKAFLIKNAIDCKKYSYNIEKREEIRIKLGIESEVVIGFVGSLKPQKNVNFLIDIFVALINTYKDLKVKLMIVGTGELEEEIKNKVNKLEISQNVLFLGERKDVSDLMQAMDVFVLPSLYEGLGLVLVEAQVAGLSCIASSEVPKEVDFTSNIKFIPLEKKCEYWAKEVYFSLNKKRERKDYFDIAKTAGYEIETATRELERFYCEGNKNNE